MQQSKINLRGNRVAIEKVKKATKGQQTGFIVVPEGEEYLGIIRYVGDAAAQDLKVGQKVYFGTNLQTARIGGVELCVMEDTQVYAIVE